MGIINKFYFLIIFLKNLGKIKLMGGERSDRTKVIIVLGVISLMAIFLLTGCVPFKKTVNTVNNSKDKRRLVGTPPNKTDGKHSEEITIDVMIGYSYLIESSEGGRDAALALFNKNLSVTNTTHKNSGTGVQFRIKEYVRLDNFEETNPRNAWGAFCLRFQISLQFVGI